MNQASDRVLESNSDEVCHCLEDQCVTLKTAAMAARGSTISRDAGDFQLLVNEQTGNSDYQCATTFCPNFNACKTRPGSLCQCTTDQCES